jgi:hypothetical protein
MVDRIPNLMVTVATLIAECTTYVYDSLYCVDRRPRQLAFQ